MKKVYLTILASAVMSLFVGCGGGGGGTAPASGGTSGSSSTTSLQDSALQGVEYKCSSKPSVKLLTNASGEFTCPVTDTVDFSIGGVSLGNYFMVSNKQNLFLGELFGYDKGVWGEDKITLALRFLQSLDADGDASNGIDINSSTRSALTNTVIDLYDNNTTATQNKINTAFATMGIALKDAKSATTHYANTLITHGVTLKETYRDEQWYIDPKEEGGIDYNKSSVLHDYTGKGVKICVVDTYMDPTHEDLSIGTIFQDANATVDEHGTEVTGVINGQVNGKGIRGIAPDANITFINYYNFTDYKILNDINDSGCDIVSLSMASADNNNKLAILIKDKFIALATSGRANHKGVIFVQGVGNDNAQAYYDQNLSKYEIIVGASNIYNTKTAYSNFSDDLDIVAPGGEGSYPIFTTEIGNQYKGVQGTSFSTPVVSSVAALMLEANPNLTSIQVQNIIKQTADKIGGETYSSDVLGIGTWNKDYGYGKINAYKAIQATIALKP